MAVTKKNNRPRKVTCKTCPTQFETTTARKVYCDECAKKRDLDHKARYARNKAKKPKEAKPFVKYLCCGVVMDRLYQTEVYKCLGKCRCLRHEDDMKKGVNNAIN